MFLWDAFLWGQLSLILVLFCPFLSSIFFLFSVFLVLLSTASVSEPNPEDYSSCGFAPPILFSPTFVLPIFACTISGVTFRGWAITLILTCWPFSFLLLFWFYPCSILVPFCLCPSLSFSLVARLGLPWVSGGGRARGLSFSVFFCLSLLSRVWVSGIRQNPRLSSKLLWIRLHNLFRFSHFVSFLLSATSTKFVVILLFLSWGGRSSEVALILLALSKL